MKQLKTNLEEKTLPKFLSSRVLEENENIQNRMLEEVKGKKALSEQIEVASSLGSNHKYVQRAMFIKKSKDNQMKHKKALGSELTLTPTQKQLMTK